MMSFGNLSFIQCVNNEIEVKQRSKVGIVINQALTEAMIELINSTAIEFVWSDEIHSPSLTKKHWLRRDVAEFKWDSPAFNHCKHVYYNDHSQTISFYMALSAFVSGIKQIHCIQGPSIISIKPINIIGKRIRCKTQNEVYKITTELKQILTKTVVAKKLVTPAYKLLKTSAFWVFNISGMQKIVDTWLFKKKSQIIYKTLKKQQLQSAVIKPNNKILIINHSLAWGGAERQIVNLVVALEKQKSIEVKVLCEDLSSDTNYNFYRWHLDENNVDISELKSIELSQPAVNSESFSALLDLFPEHIQQDIWKYFCLFRKMEPSVIHVWQDSTSIKAAVAGLISGVPSIIMSTRNVAPNKFSYIQPYMKPAYKALLQFKNIQMINNSKAGARDYEHWLDMPINTIDIVYNGFEESRLQVPSDEEIQKYRDKLGISNDKIIVGSIFRFYQEKDPILWIKTAKFIANKIPNVCFLLIGTGPMRELILDEGAKQAIKDKIYMPGTEKRPALPLSIMNTFLLTSKMEGTPNVLIEAQWMGLPVVSTDAGGSREAFIDEKTGYLCKRRDPEYIATQVVKTLRNENWLLEARKQSKKFVNEKFGLNRMVDAYIQHY